MYVVKTSAFFKYIIIFVISATTCIALHGKKMRISLWFYSSEDRKRDSHVKMKDCGLTS